MKREEENSIFSVRINVGIVLPKPNCSRCKNYLTVLCINVRREPKQLQSSNGGNTYPVLRYTGTHTCFIYYKVYMLSSGGFSLRHDPVGLLGGVIQKNQEIYLISADFPGSNLRLFHDILLMSLTSHLQKFKIAAQLFCHFYSRYFFVRCSQQHISVSSAYRIIHVFHDVLDCAWLLMINLTG